jgi:hypothetical protein
MLPHQGKDYTHINFVDQPVRLFCLTSTVSCNINVSAGYKHIVVRQRFSLKTVLLIFCGY